MENEIFEILKRMNYDTTLEEVTEFISGLKIEDIKEAHSKRYRYEIWDKKSPINGVEADKIIKSKPYSIGQVYLIYIDGNLVSLQDHDPNKTGYEKMNKTEAKKIAEEFINNEIESQTKNTIVNLFIDQVLRKGVEN